MRMYLSIDGGRILDRKAHQFWDSNSPAVTVVRDHLDCITSYCIQIEGLSSRLYAR
jgi:hypothetical protein